MAARKYKFGILFNKFLKLVLGNYMRLLFDYRINNREVLRNIKTPYIVLANNQLLGSVSFVYVLSWAGLLCYF